MAVIIGGSGLEGVSQIVKYIKDKGGTPESLMPFYGGKVPAPEAALALGTMARAMDLGPVHEESLREGIDYGLYTRTGSPDSNRYGL